jgi:hypothetical protein
MLLLISCCNSSSIETGQNWGFFFMKTKIAALIAVLISLTATAQYRMVQGVIYSITDPNAPWTSFGCYMCVEGFTTSGDLILHGFTDVTVGDGSYVNGNRSFPMSHQERQWGQKIILRNYPYAGRMNLGEVIPPGIIAMRVTATTPSDSHLTVHHSLENNKGYAEHSTTSIGSETDLLIYDMGIDYVPPARPLTPAEEAALAKKKKSTDVRTFKWLFNQATNGSVSAQASLGEHYLYGIGTPTNHEAGIEWLQRAANAGDIHASNVLVRLSSTNAPAASDE